VHWIGYEGSEARDQKLDAMTKTPEPPFHELPNPIAATTSKPASTTGPVRSRIQLDSNLKRWFGRNLGLWRSRRLYFFVDDEVLRLDMLVRVEIYSEASHGEAAYRLSWWPEESFDFFEIKPQYRARGSADVYLFGHQMRRSQDVVAGIPINSQIRQVDEHEVIFESQDHDLHVIEHIRLVDQDRYRSRSIYCWRDGQLEVSEIHHEIRLEEAGPPLVGSATEAPLQD
jgi:hypothetical protein